MKKILLVLCLFVITTSNAQNQLDLTYHLPATISYDQSIPTPKSIIRHEVGEWHVTHDRLVNYMYALAKASDRISIEDRGSTFEGRPLLLLTITAPENHAKLDQIRDEHVALTDANSKRDINTNTMPVVVYQGFSVHGNEPSGANASLLLAYHLAAATGPEIEDLLTNTVILLDPSLNPDGLQRFAHWANTNKSITINSDPNDREFSEGWPGGRTNHYWFDLNRDWLPVQLPESRARVASFHKWMPNVLTDHHEMGSNSSFFFQPGIQSRVHPLTPAQNQVLTAEIGNYHAAALDKIGSLYYTEESFDDFYYGKGSTFPDVNGGIGILFEQGSSRGHAQQTVNGILTFPYSIRNQFTAALSTLEAAKNLRVKLLDYQKTFYQDAAKEQSKAQVKALVFGDNKDKARSFHLAEILKRHKIEVNELKEDMVVNGKQFKQSHSYMVPTEQRNAKLIKAIFERRTSFTDSLFYDISAWTFPLAFNLNYEELKSTSNLGSSFDQVLLEEGAVTNKSDYAYLMEWHEYYTPKALNRLLQKGIRVKVGMKPFSLEGKNYDYGTILVAVQIQNMDSQEVHAMLSQVAKECHVNFTGVNTGLTQGIDLGSNQFRNIAPQRIGMLVGRGVSSYDAGEIWHLFDQRYQMNITKLDLKNLRTADLSKYTTIIMPNMSTQLEENLVKKLENWVRSGGTLIGYKNSVKWLSTNKFINLEYVTPKVEASDITFEQRRNFSGAQVIGGTIFNTKLDRSHPINFGYQKDYLPMFRRTKIFIKPNKSSYNNPIQYTNNPLLGGYISKQNLDVLKNTVPFQTNRLGSGRVTVFTDNTNFRAFWYGTNKLLMNAIFFAGAM